MIDKEVTVDDVKRLLASGKNRGQLVKYLYHLFEYPSNFETFCRVVLPDAFTKPFGDFHTEIINTFQSNTTSVVAAPRGHGKSTLIGLGYVLWMTIYKKEKYIIYTSQNHAKSIDFLEPIKHELQNNKMIAFIYGSYKIKSVKDDDDQLGKRDREDCFDYRGIRIQALSFEKNIRGLKFGASRPTLIILDDIEDDQRVLNPELRRKDYDKLNKQIVPSVDAENGKIKMIGTILHHDSILSKQLRLYDGKIYRAIKEDGTPLFPALYTPEKLEERKRVMGSSSFESEYMNNPVDDTASIIKRDWIMQAFDETMSFFDDIPTYDFKYQGVDFAFSDRITADKSAYIGIGATAGKYEVFQCIIKKGLTITQQFDYIEMISSQVGYNDNALEENSIRSMSNELMNYNFPFTLFWTGAADAANKDPAKYDKDFEGKRHTVGKLAMINRLATQFENNRIKIPYKTERDKEIAHQIMDECTTFARQDGKLVETGVHGDIPIALGYAIERAEMDKLDFAFEL